MPGRDGGSARYLRVLSAQTNALTCAHAPSALGPSEPVWQAQARRLSCAPWVPDCRSKCPVVICSRGMGWPPSAAAPRSAATGSGIVAAGQLRGRSVRITCNRRSWESRKRPGELGNGCGPERAAVSVTPSLESNHEPPYKTGGTSHAWRCSFLLGAAHPSTAQAPQPDASEPASTGDGHGTITGVAEVAEPQLHLVAIDTEGETSMLDLLNGTQSRLGKVRSPS